jgi:hypothetical protein
MSSPTAAITRLAFATLAVGAWGCVNPQAQLIQLLEARRLASELHVEFTKATEAANRAVMADTDEASAAAADEARRAREIVERDVQALHSLLQSVGYGADLKGLEAFNERFEEYRRLDDEILPLAVENTNLKAQRLSFGPGREAAEAFRTALDASARVSATGSCCTEAIAARARTALLEIQVLQAPHIAESDDAAMTRIEAQMASLAEAARQALQELRAGPERTAAMAALDRFLATNQEIVALSRRNSNVRSLALSLGRKRTVAAECEDRLRALEQALAKHEFTATR